MILKICNLSFVCSIRLHSIRLHSVRLHSVRLHSLVASLHSAPLVFFSLSPPQNSASCKLRFDCDLQMAKLNKLAEPCLGEEKTVIKMWTVIKCFVNYNKCEKILPLKTSTVRFHCQKVFQWPFHTCASSGVVHSSIVQAQSGFLFLLVLLLSSSLCCLYQTFPSAVWLCSHLSV